MEGRNLFTPDSNTYEGSLRREIYGKDDRRHWDCAVLETRTFYGPKYAIALHKKDPNRSKSCRMSSKCPNTAQNGPKRAIDIRNRLEHCAQEIVLTWNTIPFRITSARDDFGVLSRNWDVLDSVWSILRSFEWIRGYLRAFWAKLFIWAHRTLSSQALHITGI